MDLVQKLTKQTRAMFRSADMNSNGAIGIFIVSILYMLYMRQPATIALALGIAMILFVATSGNLVASLVAGALVGLLALYYSRSTEGFTSSEDDDDDVQTEEAFEDVEDEVEAKPTAPPKKKKRTAAAAAKKNPPPDHGERAEMFELGKKYKGPSEEDDGEFHLDAGTTFLNAYKALKPDQVAAMTKDTQDLMQTQKQLMSTLQTLKPLISDGKEMMDMFQSYFGGGKASLT
jgi:hypothetical protein